MRSIKQHIKYFNFRSEVQLAHPVFAISSLSETNLHHMFRCLMVKEGGRYGEKAVTYPEAMLACGKRQAQLVPGRVQQSLSRFNMHFGVM